MLDNNNLLSNNPQLLPDKQPIKKIDLVCSHAMINNLVPGIALAKEMCISMEKFIKWNVDKYAHCGYHDLWVQRHGLSNIREYSRFFVAGRQLVCDGCIIRESDHEIVVESKVWYLTQIVEALFFYDIELEELCSFIASLATEHAKHCGIDLMIKYAGELEIAYLKPSVNNQ